MISDLDDHVGAILDRLGTHGLIDNTIVIFTSDNGTTHGASDPAFGVGGVDAAFFNSTAGLRGLKGSVYEGGIRVPCLVRWPGHTAPGSTTDLPSYFPDWFPTLCEVAGTKAPDNLDGESLIPFIQTAVPSNPAFARRKPMIWEFHGYGGQIAVMDGKWKAVRQKVRSKQPGAWELYDLQAGRAGNPEDPLFGLFSACLSASPPLPSSCPSFRPLPSGPRCAMEVAMEVGHPPAFAEPPSLTSTVFVGPGQKDYKTNGT